MPLLTAELRDESGDVLARAFDEGAIARARVSFGDSSSVCVRFIDPYGDTVFNPQQARILSVELSALAAAASDERDRARLLAVAALADQCANGVHVLLWLIGD